MFSRKHAFNWKGSEALSSLSSLDSTTKWNLGGCRIIFFLKSLSIVMNFKKNLKNFHFYIVRSRYQYKKLQQTFFNLIEVNDRHEECLLVISCCLKLGRQLRYNCLLVGTNFLAVHAAWVYIEKCKYLLIEGPLRNFDWKTRLGRKGVKRKILN